MRPARRGYRPAGSRRRAWPPPTAPSAGRPRPPPGTPRRPLRTPARRSSFPAAMSGDRRPYPTAARSAARQWPVPAPGSRACHADRAAGRCQATPRLVTVVDGKPAASQHPVSISPARNGAAERCARSSSQPRPSTTSRHARLVCGSPRTLSSPGTPSPPGTPPSAVHRATRAATCSGQPACFARNRAAMAPRPTVPRCRHGRDVASVRALANDTTCSTASGPSAASLTRTVRSSAVIVPV